MEVIIVVMFSVTVGDERDDARLISVMKVVVDVDRTEDNGSLVRFFDSIAVVMLAEAESDEGLEGSGVLVLNVYE